MNVYTDDDKELVIEAHLPNFDQQDIDMQIDNGILKVFIPLTPLPEPEKISIKAKNK